MAAIAICPSHCFMGADFFFFFCYISKNVLQEAINYPPVPPAPPYPVYQPNTFPPNIPVGTVAAHMPSLGNNGAPIYVMRKRLYFCKFENTHQKNVAKRLRGGGEANFHCI